MKHARFPIARTSLALLLSFTLAFMVPAPALAELGVARLAASPVGNESSGQVMTCAQDGFIWSFRLAEDGACLLGCRYDPEWVAPADEGGGQTEGETGQDGEGEDSTEATQEPVATDPGQEEPAPEPEPEPEDIGTIELPASLVVDGKSIPVVAIANSCEAANDPRDDASSWAATKDREGEVISDLKLVASDGIERIEDRAFINCDNLKGISFGEGSALGKVGKRAFMRSGITEFSMPADLKDLDSEAFMYCDELEEMRINDALPESKWVKEDGTTSDVFTNPFSGLRHASFSFVSGGSSSDSYSISDSISDSISGSGMLLSADKTVLYACTQKALGAEGNRNLAIPDGVTEIAQYAAIYNDSIVSLAIPSSVVKIDNYAFYHSLKMEKVAIGQTTQASASTRIGQGSFQGGAVLAKVDIAEGIARIQDEAFEGCAQLATVSFHTGLKAIGQKAFQGPNELESLALPNTVESLGANAFANCASLKWVTLPNGNAKFTRVPEQCFLGCPIEEVFIPASVTDIDARAFAAGVTGEEAGALQSVEGCAGIQRIRENAFRGSASPLAFKCGADVEYIMKAGFAGFTAANPPEYLQEEADGYYRWDAKVYLSGTKDYSDVVTAKDQLNQARKAAHDGSDAYELTLDADLMEAAMTRAVELSVRCPNDDGHSRPLGIPFDTVDSKVDGELYAYKSSLADAVDKWKEPATSKILNADDYKSVGIGCFVNNGSRNWVVLFGKGEATTPDTASYSGGQFGQYAVSVKLGQQYPKFNATSYSTSGKRTGFEPSDDATIMITCNNGSDTVSLPDAQETFTFGSTNPDIATVDATGSVTFKKGGDVTVFGYLKGSEISQGYLASYEYSVKPQKNIGEATVSGLKGKIAYTGKAITQAPVVKINKSKLVEGVDYTVKYSKNKKVGTATITIIGMGNYDGKIERTFKITQASNSIESPVVRTYKRSLFKKSARSFELPNPRFGKATFKLAAKDKKGVLSLSGKKVIVKKGVKKGTYSMKVRATAKATKNYKKLNKVFKVKLTVK